MNTSVSILEMVVKNNDSNKNSTNPWEVPCKVLDFQSLRHWEICTRCVGVLSSELSLRATVLVQNIPGLFLEQIRSMSDFRFLLQLGRGSPVAIEGASLGLSCFFAVDVWFLFARWQNHACKIQEISHYCSWLWIPKYPFVDSLCLTVSLPRQENVPSIVLILFSVEHI